MAEAFKEEKILDNVNARYMSYSAFFHSANASLFRSQELFAALQSLRNDPAVGSNIMDIRGTGLMVGVEFASPSYPLGDPVLKPSAPKGLASRVARRCMDKGLLILTTSIYEVVRFIPPLNISRADLEKGCEIFAAAVKDVIREG